MNKLDTEYATLADVPQSVVQFYEEETRTRVTGHTEPDEEGNSTPITEEYTVVVLNKPDIVLYSDVARRISERKSRDVVNAELARAIEWEEFHYGHDLAIAYKEALSEWDDAEPMQESYTKDEPNYDGSFETMCDQDAFNDAHQVWQSSKPTEPAINLANRRTVYFEEVEQVDLTLSVISGEPTITYDDDNFVKHIKPTTSPKPKEEIAEINGKAAIVTRHETIYSNLPTVKGDIDVGQGKDGIYGISNIMSAISAYNTGMMGPVLEVNWIMSDNSVVTLTIEELNQISADFSLRKQQVFNAYGEWRAGGMQTPFKFVGADYE